MPANDIGQWYEQRRLEANAAHDRLVAAREAYAAAEARRPIGADGHPVLTDEANAAYAALRKAERAYERAAYVGD